ncbi:MAG TPA: hypothetical protein VLD67_07535 [Vicinamibacterales bacterium]|nr:hypothetical protein [Vicinamibacterales bacterium]
MAGKIKTWVWVVVGVVVVGILGVVAMAALAAYFFAQHIDTRAASPMEAASEFEEVKARFSDQKPLIELDDRGRFVRTNPDRPLPRGTTKPTELHVLAFDADDGRMVRMTIPFWLLRLKLGGSRIDLNGDRVDLEDLHLTVEDLESFGPTLMLDRDLPGQDRVLVWSQ